MCRLANNALKELTHLAWLPVRVGESGSILAQTRTRSFDVRPRHITVMSPRVGLAHAARAYPANGGSHTVHILYVCNRCTAKLKSLLRHQVLQEHLIPEPFNLFSALFSHGTTPSYERVGKTSSEWQ